MKLSTTIGESARQTGWARDTVLIYSRLIWCHEIAKRPYRADIGCSSYSLDGTRDTGARVDKESAAESTTVHGRIPLVQRLGGVRRSRALPAFPRIPGCHARRRRDRSRRRHVAASSPASRDPTPGCAMVGLTLGRTLRPISLPSFSQNASCICRSRKSRISPKRVCFLMRETSCVQSGPMRRFPIEWT